MGSPCGWHLALLLPRSCAECLGLLGALDPARVSPELRAPPDLIDTSWPLKPRAGAAAGGGAAGGAAAGGEAGRKAGGLALEVALMGHLVGGV